MKPDDEEGRPVYVVFCGVNGAGKSTFFRSGFWRESDADAFMARVNPDETIRASGKSWDSATDQLAAGKRALETIERLFEQRASLNQETTLAGRGSLLRIQRAHELGYRIRLFYIGVDRADIALERIRHRVEAGGHDIDSSAVRRRFDASLSAFGRALDYSVEAQAFDNTDAFTRLAAWKNGTLCWMSGDGARMHPWLARAMQSDRWRM